MSVVTTGNLVDQLIGFEVHNSAFETMIRSLPVPVIDGFGPGSNGGVPQFIDQGDRVGPVAKSDIDVQFPKISAETAGRVLSVVPSSDSVRGRRLAVLFSGGPAAGGHNVVAGIRRVLGESNTLFGVKAGPKGLMNGDCFEIGLSDVDSILNTGGFDFLGSDRTKIKSESDFQAVLDTVKRYQLDGIIVVGGDDSNTNAAFLAEFLADHRCAVIGVPKTIDGDLQVGSLVPISFGFDTATKIYSEMVGNILQDTPSSRKYWHFIKLMGRSASHVALEVALQTHPAVTLISEEIAQKKWSLSDVVNQIAGAVVDRSKHGFNYGVVLVPEGVIEFIPEIKVLIRALNESVATHHDMLETMPLTERVAVITGSLQSDMQRLFLSLPEGIQRQLVMDRDSHGNLQVSQIPSEELFVELTKRRVAEIDPTVKFSPLNHFLGYEGRCGAPTRFDAIYTYNLGLVAGALALRGRSGYMAGITDIFSGGRGVAIPLTSLITSERRSGSTAMVIEKALVNLESPAFKFFEKRRLEWVKSDRFSSPGPRQYWGETSRQAPLSVALNQSAKGLLFEIGSDA